MISRKILITSTSVSIFLAVALVLLVFIANKSKGIPSGEIIFLVIGVLILMLTGFVATLSLYTLNTRIKHHGWRRLAYLGALLLALVVLVGIAVSARNLKVIDYIAYMLLYIPVVEGTYALFLHTIIWVKEGFHKEKNK